MGIPRKEQSAYFTSLYEQYHKSICVYVYHRVGNWHIAEELSQDIFLKAYLALDRLESKMAKSWLYKIALNTVRDYFKSYSRRNDSMSEIETCFDIVTSDIAETVIDQLTIQETFEQLKPQHRALLTRYHIQGYSQAEDAKAGIATRDEIKQRTYYARRVFKDAYRKTAN